MDQPVKSSTHAAPGPKAAAAPDAAPGPVVAAAPDAAAAAAPAPFAALTHFAGFDFASKEHQVVVVDRQGQVVVNLRFDDEAAGWSKLRQTLDGLRGAGGSSAVGGGQSGVGGAGGAVVGVAIETSSGAVVERLLAMPVTVYPMNPKAAERYRDRKAPSGVKDDQRDAFSFADALRTDGHGWRALKPLDPLTQELRLLCRDEIALIEQRTALVLQLKAALHEYFPAALEAFDDWTLPAAWVFIEQFPTPAELVKAGKRRWEKFLHVHQLYRPQTYEKRLAIFARADQFAGTAPITKAKSLLAVSLARMLRILETQLQHYRDRILDLFNQHPDRDLFGSLPGAGEKLAPRLLAECDDPRFDSPQALQCHAGTAPVTKKSGKSCFVLLRQACNKILRATVHLWANCSRDSCAWAEVYYQQKRKQGKSHAAALRCLGQRWLKILHAMIQHRKPYDEALHTRNQLLHGSWVLTIPTANQPT